MCRLTNERWRRCHSLLLFKFAFSNRTFSFSTSALHSAIETSPPPKESRPRIGIYFIMASIMPAVLSPMAFSSEEPLEMPNAPAYFSSSLSAWGIRSTSPMVVFSVISAGSKHLAKLAVSLILLLLLTLVAS